MFRNVWDALRKNPLVDDSYEIMDRLHHDTQEMFIIAMKGLVDGEDKAEEVLRMDKGVNRKVQLVRKKVFEYLSMSSVPNITAGLTLISLVIDYERIGDYAKDLALMREEYGFEGDLRDETKEVLEDMKDQISLMMLEAHRSMEKNEVKYPTKVTLMERELKEMYEKVAEAVLEKGYDRREGMVVLISSRIIKRIGGHLDNIASAGARPFPKLGFKPGASSWED